MGAQQLVLLALGAVIGGCLVVLAQHLADTVVTRMVRRRIEAQEEASS